MICTLGYSSAWAYDRHALNTGNTQLISSSDVYIDAGSRGTQAPEQQLAVDTSCDYCNHIAAHLVAIFTQNNYSFSANQTSNRLALSENFISFVSSPDLRPPRT